MSAYQTILPPALRYLRSVHVADIVSTTVSGTMSWQNTTTLSVPSAMRAFIHALSLPASRISYPMYSIASRTSLPPVQQVGYRGSQ